MTTSSDESPAKPGQVPASLVANLGSVLAAHRPLTLSDADSDAPAAAESAVEGEVAVAESEAAEAVGEERKPVVLVTSADGIRSPGLTALVGALARDGRWDVHVCAPQSDKSASAHSITVRETIAATSVDFTNAKAFEVSGTPVDCVSLALSGRLFSWSKPALVISGINTGSNCSRQMFYSAAIAAAREALMCGVPSLAISLNWKKDESKESDFKDAVDVCMPLINAALRDVEKGLFPKHCLLNIGVPSSPTTNKGYMLTKQSQCTSGQSWQAVSASRPSAAAHVMAMHQSLGIQLAQLGKDASAAGAARRINTQRKTVEIESVAAPRKPEAREIVKKFFRAEFLHGGHEDLDEGIDLRALENGFISVTPLHLHLHLEPEIQASASEWVSSAIAEGPGARGAA